MKCTLCGKKLEPLKFYRLKIKEISKIKILDETAKQKETIVEYDLCDKCQEEISSQILINKFLNAHPERRDEIQDHDTDALLYEIQNQEKLNCDGNCVDCDGGR